MKLHIIFLAGVNLSNADDITKMLKGYTVPHGHEVVITAVPGNEPKLLGVVVVDENSETKLDAEYTDMFDGEMNPVVEYQGLLP